jgi:hypothetical protein
VLTEIEEAIVVAFRRRPLLPLDDVLGCLRESIPKLSRSALHRCLARHGISRLPISEKSATKRGRFAQTTIGSVRIDVGELHCAEGKVHMFLAIDRVSKFTPAFAGAGSTWGSSKRHDADRRSVPAQRGRGIPRQTPQRADR